MDGNYRQRPSAERNGKLWDCSQLSKCSELPELPSNTTDAFTWTSIFPYENPWHHLHWLLTSCVSSLNKFIYTPCRSILQYTLGTYTQKNWVSDVVVGSKILRDRLSLFSIAVLELQNLKQVLLDSTSPPAWEVCASNISAMDQLLQPLVPQ